MKYLIMASTICINRLAIVSILVLLSLCSCLAQSNKGDANKIIGKWKYAKHFNWRVTSYSEKQLTLFKSSILHIEGSKLYFDRLRFIDTCRYSNVRYSGFFDRKEKEPNVIEDRAMAVKYTKEQLSTIKKIDFDCDNCLGTLYLKNDTLILNYCGGYTFFMTRIN